MSKINSCIFEKHIWEICYKTISKTAICYIVRLSNSSSTFDIVEWVKNQHIIFVDVSTSNTMTHDFFTSLPTLSLSHTAFIISITKCFVFIQCSKKLYCCDCIRNKTKSMKNMKTKICWSILRKKIKPYIYERWWPNQDLGYKDREKRPGDIGYEWLKITGAMYTVDQKSLGSVGKGQRAHRMDKENFIVIYNSYTRWHLEYYVQAWSPHLVKDKDCFKQI